MQKNQAVRCILMVVDNSSPLWGVKTEIYFLRMQAGLSLRAGVKLYHRDPDNFVYLYKL